jgi:superfamily I DNA/RNA helicase
VLSDKNTAIIACAGAGKTTTLVDRVALAKNARILFTTYTNENVAQIRQYLVQKYGYIPRNISVLAWCTFLLRDGVRPYQNYLSAEKRVKSIFYPRERKLYQKKDDYFTNDDDIYCDKLSEFVFECNKISNGRVVGRLERLYDYILIDELQDLSGYDLDVLRELLLSRISITLVGDPRQSTYSTNRASKNRKYKRQGVVQWIEERGKAKEIKIEYGICSRRCNQRILDIADCLFPDFNKTTTSNHESTGHDGVFAIKPDEVEDYSSRYNPIVLRHSIKTKTHSCRAINIGVTKGHTYDRVLVFPTKPMRDFLRTGDPENAGDQCRLYVAMTRAKFSVAFVVEEPDSLVWLNQQKEASAP